jgi:hypothetical protein
VTSKVEAAKLGAEIGRLPDLPYRELKDRWRTLFGNPAPKHVSKQLLIKAVAYRMREKVLGGLPAETKRRFREIAAAISEGREDTLSLGPRIKPGARLVRSWQGATHIVEVLAEGFEWQGNRYGSLSAIAKAITGTNWNGYVFFGVKRRPARNKNAAGPRRPKPLDPAAAQTGHVDGARWQGPTTDA